MKTLSALFLTAAGICFNHASSAQCTGTKGPNILGAKGSFSQPFISVNTAAAACIASGSNTYSPSGNAGNSLNGCTESGVIRPCSDYTYTAASAGLGPEGRYAILKTVGNSAGGNCIKGDWRGSDHTGDGGYYMVINGAPTPNFSKQFYQIKSIPVCQGATYEFSAWAINVLPGSGPSTSPDIVVKQNDVVIARSGIISNQSAPAWVKFSGTFTATSDTINLQFINNTAVASGNDFGIDDISLNVCQSNISVEGPANACSGNAANLLFTVNDPSSLNSWHKMQLSTDGGSSYNDLSGPEQSTFSNNSYTVTYNAGTVNALMNGYRYRMVVAASEQSLGNAGCGDYNDFLLSVADCGPLPVKLTSFNGRYANGTAYLDWQTSQEINTARFEIQRSYDGTNFTNLAFVHGAGNSSTVKNYSFQDNTVGGGKSVYYRLLQVDADGKFSLSNIIRLNPGERGGMDIYPNPFGNRFTISFPAGAATNVTLIIRNNTGQVVHTRTLKVNRGNNTIPVDQLPPLGSGTYFVQLTGEGILFNTKLQKQ